MVGRPLIIQGVIRYTMVHWITMDVYNQILEVLTIINFLSAKWPLK